MLIMIHSRTLINILRGKYNEKSDKLVKFFQLRNVHEMSSNISTFFPRPHYVCNDRGNGSYCSVVRPTHLFCNTSHFSQCYDVYSLPFASVSSSYAVHGELFSPKRGAE